MTASQSFTVQLMKIWDEFTPKQKYTILLRFASGRNPDKSCKTERARNNVAKCPSQRRKASRE